VSEAGLEVGKRLKELEKENNKLKAEKMELA
jgi:hypothetical protein